MKLNNSLVEKILVEFLRNETYKIGIKKAERDLHDFSLLVTDRDEFNYLFEQILFYLQNIRTK